MTEVTVQLNFKHFFILFFVICSFNVFADEATYTVTLSVGNNTEPFINSTNMLPLNNSVYNQTNIISLRVNASDTETPLSTLNVTATFIFNANQTSQLLSFNSTSGYFEGEFTQTLFVGNYNLFYQVMDEGGLQDNETRNFSVVDITSPNVTNILPNNDDVLEDVQIQIKAIVQDPYYPNVDEVFANITIGPNKFIVALTDNDNDSVYIGIFSQTSERGVYTIRIFANDTSNNINYSETATFEVISPSDGGAIIRRPLIPTQAIIGDTICGEGENIINSIDCDINYDYLICKDPNQSCPYLQTNFQLFMFLLIIGLIFYFLPILRKKLKRFIRRNSIGG